MDEKRRKRAGQITFLAPDEVAREAVRRELLGIIEDNLTLMREIAALYGISRAREKRRQVRSPADAAGLLTPEMGALDQEQLRVIVLNTKNDVVAIEMVYQGSVNKAQIRVGELFRPAVQTNATAVILAHNHPSGDPSPSTADIDFTRDAIEAGALLDIAVLDHVVIGQGRWVSMKRLGLGFGPDR